MHCNPLAQRSSPVALERCTLSCNRCGHHCRRWRDVTYRLRWRDVFNDWRLCGILTKSWRNRTYRWTWKTDFTTGDGAAYTAEAGEAQLKHAGAAYIEGAARCASSQLAVEKCICPSGVGAAYTVGDGAA